MYVTDESGARRFVQVDLEVYGSEWLEDLLDAAVVAARRDEETVPFAEVLAGLEAAGKLDADEVAERLRATEGGRTAAGRDADTGGDGPEA